MPTTYTVVDVQQATGSLVTSVQTPAFASSPTTGDLIVVAMSTWDNGGSGGSGASVHSAPTDTAGNTYVQIGSQIHSASGSSNQCSMWACVGATGGSTFRVTSHQTSAYATVIAWCVRPSTVIGSNGDVASTVAATTNANDDPTTSSAPAGDSFFLCLATAAGANNGLSEGTGWNTTGVNGFTSGMQTNAKYGLQSATVSLYTEYQIATSTLKGVWVDGSVFNARGVIIASFGPAGGGGGPATFNALLIAP